MRNKVIIVFMLMLMIISIFSLGAYAAEYKEEVSVGLYFGDELKNSFTITSSGGVNVYNVATGEVLYTSAPGEEVYIQQSSGGFVADGKFDTGSIAKISFYPADGGTIKCDGKGYRGNICAEVRNGGELLVINYVNIDDYVTSVLGKEMSYSWPKEALKAQSVCARNFVLCRGNAHKAYNFDVCTTTHCQVYGGVASEHANTRAAVEETKGVVATYNGKLVSLYFYATSGGATEDVENVWGSPYGYLKGVDDPYENPQQASKYNWSVSFSRGEIEEKLAQQNVDIGKLENITVDSKSESGRVTKMTFHGTNSDHTVKLEKCRTVLGLYSQRFDITTDSKSTLMTTGGVATGNLYACSADGVKLLKGLRVLSGNNKKGTISISSEPAENYVINGGGYGHGVGMSQWGARGMAENGFTYGEILRHYFTDIELE